MNTPKKVLFRRCAIALLCAAAHTGLRAQQAPASVSPATPPIDDDVITLSPFEVTSEGDTGYTATSTLAGTRVRTDLRDIASSLSVVTTQFLKDTGATSNESLLPYQVNTEVGGLYGNFAGIGNVQAASENGKLANPNSNTRVRGLDEADNTKDYFLTSIPWDSYTVDRVDLQRGPNSILFGVGSPAGIINTTTIGARMDKSGGKVETTLGSYGSKRFNLDYNHLLIKGELALRVAAVDDDTKFRQDPAYAHAKRVFGALRYTPQLFSSRYADKLSVRVNAEAGRLRSNRPRMLPPIDKITNFFNPSIFKREGGQIRLYDPTYIWSYYMALDRGTKVGDPTFNKMSKDPGYEAVPGLGNEMGAGMVTYINGQSQPVMIREHKASQNFGINSAGVIDKSIGALPFGNYAQSSGLYDYSLNLNALDPTKYPAAAKQYYKDLVLTDPSVFDFYNKLLDGDNKWESTDFKSLNVAIGQNFFGNRLGFEFVYDYQNSTTAQVGYLGGNPFISVDVNKYTMDTLASYFPNPVTEWAPNVDNGGGTVNPNAGRAYTSGTGYGNSTNIVRDSWRVTTYGELRGNDLFRKDSFLAKLLSRNVLSGLLSSDTVDRFDKNWTTERTDVNWTLNQGATTAGRRAVGFTVYLSDSLVSRSSASGLGLDRIRSSVAPYGQVQAKYFDSHWKYSLNPNDPTYINPAAPFTNPANQQVLTQSENPANYVGWTTKGMEILSSTHGAMDQMYTGASKNRNKLESQGLTLQSYIWNDMLVPTVGWRKDRIETYGTGGAVDQNTDVASVNFENIPTSKAVSQGETTTWGAVARLPKKLRGKLPLDSDISVFYNSSENFRAVNRVGYDGMALANPKGQSKDYGFAISALEDRVSLKVTWYDTQVKDVDIPGGNALGQNVWFLGNMQAWGTAAVQLIKAGRAGERSGRVDQWNYALVDENKWGDATWENPNSTEFLTHPTSIKQAAAVTAWLATMPTQAYYDAFGYPVDVAKAKSSDWNVAKTAISNGTWDMNGGVGSIQPRDGGKVNGMTPVGTIDQESKGIEFEFAAKPLKNWDLVLNVAKTNASRTGLGASFVDWIESQKTRLDGPAGDLRLWWAGDKTFRDYYDGFIYQAYLFQKESDGAMAPEIRPWRFNVISNFRFERGLLKGVNVGGGYRWQDDVILGYALNDAKTKLDINRWIGYERKLSKGINWRLQLNLRNVGDKAHLIPVSANPDGSYAAMRIADGCSWAIRNSFEF